MDHTYWYLTRAAGFVAYLLLFACVSLGLSMTGNVLDRWLQRHRVYDMHRFLSIVTLIVVVFHVLIVLPDDFIGFSLTELLLPFASPFEPTFMALGVISLYLTAAIIGSFYLLPRLPYPAWRLLHYLTFAAYVMALAHGVGAGTDTPGVWAMAIYVTTGAGVGVLLINRLLKGSTRGIIVPREPPIATAKPSRSSL